MPSHAVSLNPVEDGRKGGFARAAKLDALRRRVIAMQASRASHGTTLPPGEEAAYWKGFAAGCEDAFKQLYGAPLKPPRFATKAPSRDLANPAVRRRMDEAEREKRAQIARDQQYKPA